MASDPFRVEIYDSRGPGWLRFALPAAALVALGAGLIRSVPDWVEVGAPVVALFYALLARVVAPRFPPAHAMVEARANEVRIRAGVRSRTLRASTLGAGMVVETTAGSCVLLAPPTVLRRTPIILRCARREDAEAIRLALGIERAGRGVFEWEAKPVLVDRAQMIVRILAAAVLAVTVGVGIANPGRWGGYAFAATFWLTMLAFVLWLVGIALPKAMLLVSPEGVVVPGKHGARMIGRGELRHARRTVTGIEIEGKAKVGVELRPSRTSRGLDAAEVELLPQIIDAMAKSEAKEERDPTSALLERGEDTTPRWLARLDALAAGGADAYRTALGSVEHVLRVLESPDTHADVRMGAARVLARTAPEVRQRVDDAVASMADEGLRDRVRIAMIADPAEAAEGLEEHGVAAPHRAVKRQ